MNQVVCNRHNDPRCYKCGHDEPHLPGELMTLDQTVCTKWGNCQGEDEVFRVRCVRVKEAQAGYWRIGAQVIDEDGNRGIVVILWNDGDICSIENDAAHPNPQLVDEEAQDETDT